MTRTFLRYVLPAIAAAVILAGCGDSEQASTSQGAGTSTATTSERSAPNAADVTFARNMVPHHRQALEMAKLASTEIQQMNGWLARWGAMSTSSMPSMTGMDQGSMPGEMTDAELRQLEQANGAEFDRMFLEMMIRHHQGAVEMAKTELNGGRSTDAKALAQRIIDAQQAEITQMRGLLKAM